jgi:hypothetical protein
VKCTRLVPVWLLVAATSACAPKLAQLPTGPGTPFPDSAAAYRQAITPCRDLRTLVAVLAVSGRAGGQRLRASIDAGFEAPDKAMLEFPAPGRPYFTFVANGTSSTLILPRDGRVLTGAPPAEALEALTGIKLGPAELRSIVSGCGLGPIEPTAGRAYDGGRADATDGNRTAYLERIEGRWRLTADRRGPFVVLYSDFRGGRPSTIRLTSIKDSHAVRGDDLTIRLSQVDIDQPIQAQAFAPEIPTGLSPITLEELRKAGPLGR